MTQVDNLILAVIAISSAFGVGGVYQGYVASELDRCIAGFPCLQ